VNLLRFLRRRPAPAPWPTTPAEIEAASRSWPRSTENRGRKVACPACGATGYPGGAWTHAHLIHVRCSDCGRTITARGLNTHKAAVARHAAVRASRDEAAEVRRLLS
jgi:DNA-directed RNA polymerase subunit RPC12/RpoP